MKIAVTGKGGVGKTTVAAILARLYADEGRKVLCADVDPDANLGAALGFSEEELAGITPISKMRKLIAERTGAGADTYGKFFKINPKVDDIPDLVAKEHNGVRRHGRRRPIRSYRQVQPGDSLVRHVRRQRHMGGRQFDSRLERRRIVFLQLR